MASKLIQTMLSDKTLGAYFTDFVKSKGLSNELMFTMANEPRHKIYDLFYSKTPQVKLKNAGKYAKIAQQHYMQRLDEAAAEGMIASKAHAKAVDSDIFAKIMASGKREMTAIFEGKVYSDFKKSPYYENYVKTQVCGSSLASQLKFPSSAADDLQWTKYCLLTGSKSGARLAADRAMKEMQKKPVKGAKIRSADELVKTLDKIKIKLAA